MSDPLLLALAFGLGLLLGAVFFGGLWWTVQKGTGSKWPAVWFMGSLLVRTGIVLAGFYLVGRGRWEPLVLCLIGFFMARVIALRLTARAADKSPRPAAGSGHAP